MAEFTLKMIMQAVDKVTKPVGAMGKALAEFGKKAGFDKLSKDLGVFGKSLGKAGKEAVSFGKWVVGGATAAAGGLFALVKSSASVADHLAKTADKLGVGIEELQRMRYAADLSGVSTEKFDMSLQRFTRRAAEAAAGTGVAKDALNALGIELTDSNGKLRPAETLLGEVADKMAQIEDPAKRVRLAFALFDSDGVSMVNMLKNGSAAMKEAGKEAEQLGLITEEQARASEVFNDNFARLTRVITHLGHVIANDLMPYFNDGIVALKGFLLEMRPAIVKGLRDAFSLLGSIISFVVEKWNGLSKSVSDWTVLMAVGGGYLGSLVADLLELLRVFGAVRAGLSVLLTAFGIKFLYSIAGLFMPLAKLAWSLTVVTTKLIIMAVKGIAIAVRGLISLAPAMMRATVATWGFVRSLVVATGRLAMMGAKGIAAAVRGLVAMVPAMVGATVAAWGFAAALLANPITWIVAGILAAVAAGVLLWKNWDAVSDFLTGMWNDVKAAFDEGFLNGVVHLLTAFSPLALLMRGLDELVKFLFDIDLSEAGQRWISSLADGIRKQWQEISNFLGDAASEVTDFFSFGDDDEQASAGGASSRSALAPALSSALPQQASRVGVGGTVRVAFDNAPAGTRVREVHSDNPSVPIGADLGLNMGGL